MGHQTQHIASCVGQARHITNRAVGIACVAQNHLTICFELSQLIALALVSPFPMGDWQHDRFCLAIPFQPATVARINAQRGWFTEKMQPSIAGESTWQ